MKVRDVITGDMLPAFIRWYIEATRPLEDDRLAYAVGLTVRPKANC